MEGVSSIKNLSLSVGTSVAPEVGSFLSTGDVYHSEQTPAHMHMPLRLNFSLDLVQRTYLG